MPTKDRPEERDENATIGDLQQQVEQEHEESRRRKEDGTARHGKPPGVHGLGEGEPLGQQRGQRDRREGITSGQPGHFQHVEKDRPGSFEDEDEG